MEDAMDDPRNNAPRLLQLSALGPHYADAGAELNAIADRIRERFLSAGLFTGDTAKDLERLAHLAAALTALVEDETNPHVRSWLGLRRLAG
jgi:hypothetical protein